MVHELPLAHPIRRSILSPSGEVQAESFFWWEQKALPPLKIILDRARPEQPEILRECVKMARRHAGGLWVVYLFPEADDILSWVAESPGAVIMAWGESPQAAERGVRVFELLKAKKSALYSFDVDDPRAPARVLSPTEAPSLSWGLYWSAARGRVGWPQPHLLDLRSRRAAV